MLPSYVTGCGGSSWGFQAPYQGIVEPINVSGWQSSKKKKYKTFINIQNINPLHKLLREKENSLFRALGNSTNHRAEGYEVVGRNKKQNYKCDLDHY